MATCPECDAELEIDEDDLEEMEVGDPGIAKRAAAVCASRNLGPLEFDSDDEDDDEDEEKKESGEDEEEEKTTTKTRMRTTRRRGTRTGRENER